MPRRRSARKSESGRKPRNGWSGRGLTVVHRPRTLLVALLAAPIPIPIGRGPEFRPPRVGADRPAAVSCVAGAPSALRVHLELFARRRAIVIPAGIGVRRDCRYPIRTLTPTGVIDVGRRGLTLGDFFAVWRMQLTGRRMLTFHGAVRAYVGGTRWTGDPRAIPLTNRRQIVLEVGQYVPPHAFFLFPPR